MNPQVVAVHVGMPRDEQMFGRTLRTAIRKRSVTGPVAVDEAGLDGRPGPRTRTTSAPSTPSTLRRRGPRPLGDGPGRAVPRGLFGENLTTRGSTSTRPTWGSGGDGSVLLEVVGVRIPCSVFKGWMGIAGHDDTAWVKRFADEGRPGPYLRVLEPGAPGR